MLTCFARSQTWKFDILARDVTSSTNMGAFTKVNEIFCNEALYTKIKLIVHVLHYETSLLVGDALWDMAVDASEHCERQIDMRISIVV